MSIEMIPDSPIDIKDIAPAAPVFESFAANLPDTADGFAPFDSALPDDAGMLFPSDAKAVAREKKTKRVKMSKKMQKTMDKLKGKASTFPVLWFHSMAKEHPEWELDEDERDILTDSIETVFEVLDIEIQIEPLSVELTSIWWVLSYPILAFAFLFFSKKSMIVEKEKQNENVSERTI
jgi:hypothetical protein